MAEPVVWEALPKSQIDSATIDEAITAKIATHNSDPDAHLGADESIAQHRTGPIIDHPAESIYNDKLQPNMRQYMAIVDPTNEVDFATLEDAAAYCNSKGGGDILLQRGHHYISTDIVLPPTISLFGMGFDETILHMDSVGNKNISFGGYFEDPYINFTRADFTNGSDVVTFTGLTIPEGHTMLGRGFDWASVTPPILLRITEKIDDTHYRLSQNATYTTDSDFTGLVPIATLTHGSTLVTLAGEIQCGELELNTGLELSVDGFEFDYSVIYTGAPSQFYLSKPFAGTTGDYALYLRYGPTMQPIVSDMTVDADGVPGAINCNFSPFALQLQRVKFVNGNEYIANVGDGTNIDSCAFYCQDSWALYSYGSMRITRSDFYASQDGTLALGQLVGATLRDCRFVANGYTGHDWLDLQNTAVTIDNCTFEACGNFTWEIGNTGSESRASTFINNTVWMYDSSRPSFSCANTNILNNEFRGAGLTCRLTTSSQNTIMLGNRCNAGFLDSGTDNLMANNITA